MIPLLDLKAQYASVKPEVDAAVLDVLASGDYIQGGEVRAPGPPASERAAALARINLKYLDRVAKHCNGNRLTQRYCAKDLSRSSRRAPRAPRQSVGVAFER